MEDNFGINSKVDLYKRLSPALNCKKRELEKNNIVVKNEEIWNYLIKTMWIGKKDLELSEMVDDILNFNNDDICLFLKKNKTKKEKDNLENVVNQEIELL